MPLPAIAPSHLDAVSLRARFRLSGLWQTEPALSLPAALPFAAEPVPAAVLLPLVQQADGLHVLFTQRASHLHDHAGQISFPGGRVEADDASEMAAALREAEEEIGLSASAVEILGQLPIHHTGTGFVVHPVVGVITTLPPLRPDPREVDHCFTVPLAYLMNPQHHQLRRAEFRYPRDPANWISRQYFVIPWQATSPQPTPGEVRQYQIWGATAAMLRNLYRFLLAPSE
ncbi:CoA pyrophosphatase [Parvibium lacunae]|uniref:CoA pyrophosphatase n=2 Tax=Parvibium lacunae TaxID=1888893 RepID=A0A368L546_9BURK|nr:CoA pyrophosphatase [Parvibium lacunae]